ncbi:hypothetical protein CSUB01_05767 [Colletotrichum sublineola]|uniref:Uncharacterized protein n=1 Tax=Colletotrichum sublineola TaxID=1173701 RepID=A0A066XQ32_COLSU|nr:hypothetical protein CSUB01_05767 [Colletotrichum sublineola]
MFAAASVPFSHSGAGNQAGLLLTVSGIQMGNLQDSRGDVDDSSECLGLVASQMASYKGAVRAFVAVVIGRNQVANGRGTPRRKSTGWRALNTATVHRRCFHKMAHHQRKSITIFGVLQCTSGGENRKISREHGLFPLWRWHDPERRKANCISSTEQQPQP